MNRGWVVVSLLPALLILFASVWLPWHRTSIERHVARHFNATGADIYVDDGRDLVVELLDAPLPDSSKASESLLAARVAPFLRDHDPVYDSTRGIDVTFFKTRGSVPSTSGISFFRGIPWVPDRTRCPSSIDG